MSYNDVKARLYHGHRKIANNTYLKLEPAYYEDEHITMTLHGNLVAMFTPTHLELFSAGWYTTTTRHRLNLALDVADVAGVLPIYRLELPYWLRVYQRNGRWYYGNYSKNDPEFYDGMKLDYGGCIIG